MNYKKLLFLFILLGSCIFSYAQGFTAFDEIGISPEVPVPPKFHSIAEYGNVETNLAYGSANITIPLFNFKSGKLNLPVSLSYNSTGNKVADEGSDYGLGWSLNIESVITRTVRGYIDEKAVHNSMNNNGWLQTLINPTTNNDFYQVLSSFTSSYDTEPDMFSYNIPGYSGTFYLGPTIDGVPFNVVMIPHHPISIVPTFKNGTVFGPTHDIMSFEIRTVDRVYRFWDVQKMDPFIGGMPDLPEYNAVWHLSSISDSYGRDAIGIEYEYETDPENYPARYSDYITYESTTGLSWFTSGIFRTASVVREVRDEVEFKEKKIRRIIGQNQKAIFSNKGKKIEVTDGIKIHDIDFVIRGFENSEECEGKTAECSRKKLQQVTVDGDVYEMKYNEEKEPPLSSKSTDHWGYYNGSGNTNGVPASVELIGGAILNPGGANREINTGKSKFGMLEKITYPTGGSSLFNWEQNTYFDGDSDEADSKYGFWHEDVFIKRPSDMGAAGLVVDWPKSDAFTIVMPDNELYIPFNDVEWSNEFLIDVVFETHHNDPCNPTPISKKPSVQFNYGSSRLFSINYEDDRLSTNCEGPYEIRAVDDSRILVNNPGLNGSIDIDIRGHSDNKVIVRIKRFGEYEAEGFGNQTNKLIGGLRIESIENVDRNGFFISKKRYSYDDKNGFSSGFLLNCLYSDIESLTPYYSQYAINGSCAEITNPNRLVLSDTPNGRILHGRPIGYQRVVEEMVNDTYPPVSLGKTEMEFSMNTKDRFGLGENRDEEGAVGNYPYTPTITQDHMRGYLKFKKVFKKGSDIPTVYESDVYNGQYINHHEILGAVIVKNREFRWGSCWETFKRSMYAIGTYDIGSQSAPILTNKTIIDYRDNGAIVSESEYDYSTPNSSKLLLPKSISKSIKLAGKTVETTRKEYTYNHEITNLSSINSSPHLVREERLLNEKSEVYAARALTYDRGYPAVLYEWESDIPVDDFQVVSSINGELILDPSYRDSQSTEIDYYESFPGRTKSVLGIDGIRSFYVWNEFNAELQMVVNNVAESPMYPNVAYYGDSEFNIGKIGGSNYQTDFLSPGDYYLEVLSREAEVIVSASNGYVHNLRDVKKSNYQYLKYGIFVNSSEFKIDIDVNFTSIEDDTNSNSFNNPIIRIYPVIATANSYKYDLNGNIRLIMDENGHMQFFEYYKDQYDRNKLRLIRDDSENIKAYYEYNLINSRR